MTKVKKTSSRGPRKISKKLLKNVKPLSEGTSKQSQQPMGIGELGKPDLVFSRKFRWTLRGTRLPEHFAKTVSFDFVKRQLSFTYYDICHVGKDGMHALVWVDLIERHQVPHEFLVFTTFDGCGSPLYRLAFFDLKILEHSSDFDYASSEESCQHITVGYQHCSKELLCCPNPFQSVRWEVRFEDEKGHVLCPNTHAHLEDRPQLDIEETEIDHLNARMHLPGKAKWQDLRIRTDGTPKKHMGEYFTKPSNKRYVVVVSQFVNDSLVETWRLGDAWWKSIAVGENECNILVSFSNAQYMNSATMYDDDQKWRREWKIQQARSQK